MNEPASPSLSAALQRFQIELPPPVVAQLDDYRQRLWEANQHLNLTRHTDFETFVARDVADSLQLTQLIDGPASVLDIGSGGGVPGIVMAIVRPDLRLELSEPVAKKARVLDQIVAALGLDVRVHARRAEQILAERRFDVCVARAVGPLDDLCRWLAPTWHNIGQLLAIKGPKWLDERARARHAGHLRGVELRVAARYATATTGAESVILRLWGKSTGRPIGKSADADDRLGD
jgi:16S rRNA (guanine527-N7)-methyltransferase